MRTSRLIALSICLNVLLGAVLIWPPRKAPIVPIRKIAPVKATTDSSAGGIPMPLLDASPSAPLDTRHLALFHWSQLESADYRVYVRNLRTVGCPETTVRDIVIPDVNGVFYERVKQIVDTVQNRFWEMLADQKAFEKMVDEKHKELDDLEKERDNALAQLLGRRADHRMQREELAQIEQIAQRKQFLDFLSAEKIEQCLALDAKFAALRDELSNSDAPLESAEVQSRSKHLQEQQKSELESLLSPDELAEYKLRNSPFANLRFQLNGFETTEADVKEMVRTQEVVSTLTQTNAPTSQRDAIKSVLGAERFAEYERTLDNRFQEFYQVADRYDLPVEKASEAYEIRKAAEDTVQNVRRGNNLNDNDRNEQLAAIHSETERALTDALGSRAFQTYRTRSGQWLAALANGNNNGSH